MKPLKKWKILIVDDSVENLKLLIGILGNNYELRIAKNGNKALEIINSEDDIDLILLDIIMPGEKNGYDVCKIVKSDPNNKHIPIIFISALSDGEEETLGFELGGVDYITKPFHPQVVKVRIDTQLRLKEEKEKSKKLLEVLLPKNVIEEYNRKGNYTPVMHNNISVLFCDLIGFTEVSGKTEPTVLIDNLSRVFTKFDQIMEENGCIRIKTIGDGYMAACGIDNIDDHASRIVQAGIDMINYIDQNKEGGIKWECRIGINSGEAISGIVGKQRFQFDLMGDDVNIAARVESNAPPMTTTITRFTAQKLDLNKFTVKSIGIKELKGKGSVELFSVFNKTIDS